MNHQPLSVKLLGTFSLRIGEKSIRCEGNRSHRVWALLAYLIHNHGKAIPSEDLISHLWNDGSENPISALKTTLHRARGLLEALEPGAGHRMILAGKGTYSWNPEIPIELDTEQLEKGILQQDYNTEQLIKVLDLYDGPFLYQLTSYAWVLPLSIYYQQLFTDGLTKGIPLLEHEHRYQEIVSLCRKALQTDIYNEYLYQQLMRSLLMLNQRQEVAAVYEKMSKLLLADLGVMPDQESRAIYREALHSATQSTFSPDALLSQLQERDPITSALCCDFDFFKILYQAQARVLIRSGDAVHTALLTLKAKPGRNLSQRSLELAMENAQDSIAHSLRKGDVVCRCSMSQLIVMLPQANFENSQKVCGRLIDTFHRKYPHSPVEIDFFVQPLLPSTDH